MSSRTRAVLVVAAAATAAAGAAVGVTLATRSDIQEQTSKPPPFVPDPTASPEVAREVREALRAWPAGTVRRLRVVAARYPGNALVRFELGIALALSGQNEEAVAAWRDAERAQPDSPSAVRAQLRAPVHGRPEPPPAGRRLPAGSAARLGGARVRGCGAGRAGQRRGPHRRGGRALRQGPARARLLATRAARAPFPGRPDGPLPPRVATHLLPRHPSGPPRAGSRPG